MSFSAWSFQFKNFEKKQTTNKKPNKLKHTTKKPLSKLPVIFWPPPEQCVSIQPADWQTDVSKVIPVIKTKQHDLTSRPCIRHHNLYFYPQSSLLSSNKST